MTKCIICKSEKARTLYEGILQCKQCSHIYADIYLDESVVKKLYNRNYFFGEEYSDYTSDRRVLEKNFKLRLEVLKKFLDPSRHRHLLEIGSAYGFFINMAKPSFKTALGMEICEDAVDYSKNILKCNTVQDDFIKYDLGPTQVDVVCMWDTIEHLQYPDQYLDKLSVHLAKGSLVAITTADIGSRLARLRKGHWRQIHPPTHVHYFSKKTLTQLLEQNGFKIIYDQYCGFYRSVEMMAHRMLLLKKQWDKLYRWLAYLNITRHDFYLNLYDIRYVIAMRQ